MMLLRKMTTEWLNSVGKCMTFLTNKYGINRRIKRSKSRNYDFGISDNFIHEFATVILLEKE
jgi:hypothetical protein